MKFCFCRRILDISGQEVLKWQDVRNICNWVERVRGGGPTRKNTAKKCGKTWVSRKLKLLDHSLTYVLPVYRLSGHSSLTFPSTALNHLSPYNWNLRPRTLEREINDLPCGHVHYTVGTILRVMLGVSHLPSPARTRSSPLRDCSSFLFWSTYRWLTTGPMCFLCMLLKLSS